MWDIVSMNSSIDALTSPLSFIFNMNTIEKQKGGWGVKTVQTLYFCRQKHHENRCISAKRAQRERKVINFGDKKGLDFSEWI